MKATRNESCYVFVAFFCEGFYIVAAFEKKETI